jgi:hypothetical protein
MKVAFGILFATELSLLAWFAQNFASANAIALGGAALAILILGVALFIMNKKAIKTINSLEDL